MDFGTHSRGYRETIVLFFFFKVAKKEFIYLFLIYNTVFVLPYISMNPPQVYTYSPFWTPHPPPSPYHPSGSSQCTSPKHPGSMHDTELILLNCGVGADSWVPWTERRSNQSILKEINPEHSLEGLMLSWNCNTLATWCKELTHWKRSWCWERLKAGGEGDNREWDGWMTSLTWWTWVWASSRTWWRTGKPGIL